MAPQPEWLEKDFYKALGVSETASAKDITKAYRQLARDHHPDANPNNAAAEDRFKEISAAYDVVGDESKRKEYDEFRRLGPLAGGRGPGGFSSRPSAPGGGGMGGFSAEDLGDMFGNLFNQRGGAARRPTGQRGPGPQRGTDLQTELTMDFRDAIDGITTTLHLTSEAACTTCNGSGAKPGTAPMICAHCHGRGVTDDNQGMFSFSRPCGSCQGKGLVITDPCPTCQSAGIVRRPRDVKVRIPAGVSDNQTIKLKGRGGPGRNGGPPGDLFVQVHVGSDDLFGRDGRNLTLVVPVTFAEAALGTRVTIPTVDGDTVTLKLPAGTRAGKVFRVKGRGIDSGRGGRGDLLVTIDVAVPAKLNKEQRAAVEAFAAATTESPRAHLGTT